MSAKKVKKQNDSDVTLGKRQRRLLSETVQIEDELIPSYTRPVLYLVASMLILFTIWSYMTELAEVTSAPGEIIPSGQIKVVQHLNGGTISELLVQERMPVKAGDVLVKLEDEKDLSDLRQIRSRLASLKLRAERQQAFVSGREPDFSGFEVDYPVMVDVQRQQLKNQILVQNSTLDVLQKQISQRQSRLEQLEESLQSALKQRDLTAEMFSMREKMAEKRLVTRITLLETQRAAVTAQGEVDRIRKEINLINQELAEAKSRLFETRNQIMETPLNQIDSLKAEIAETEEEAGRIEQRLRDLWIRSPADGLVFNLEVNTRGQVIQPGAVLMQIVPEDVELEAEVRIPPEEIGYVSLGQEVNVKVTSYDFSRYGYATGKLNRVSAFSALDEQGNPYFKGWVALDKTYMGTEEQRYPLLPGMTVTADILTGYKTLMAYLSDPITKALAQGFRER